MWTSRAASVALLVVALAGGAPRADDTHPSAPAQAPDPGFLEFLGGVDQLADVNPDYLAQANTARPGAPPPKPPVNPPPAPPASVPGAKSNE
jgi:hypothetical protein